MYKNKPQIFISYSGRTDDSWKPSALKCFQHLQYAANDLTQCFNREDEDWENNVFKTLKHLEFVKRTLHRWLIWEDDNSNHLQLLSYDDNSKYQLLKKLFSTQLIFNFTNTNLTPENTPIVKKNYSIKSFYTFDTSFHKNVDLFPSFDIIPLPNDLKKNYFIKSFHNFDKSFHKNLELFPSFDIIPLPNDLIIHNNNESDNNSKTDRFIETESYVESKFHSNLDVNKNKSSKELNKYFSLKNIRSYKKNNFFVFSSNMLLSSIIGGALLGNIFLPGYNFSGALIGSLIGGLSLFFRKREKKIA